MLSWSVYNKAFLGFASLFTQNVLYLWVRLNNSGYVVDYGIGGEVTVAAYAGVLGL